MSLKKGANRMEINKIARFKSQGFKAEDISKSLGIDLQVVKNFMNPPKKTKDKPVDNGLE